MAVTTIPWGDGSGDNIYLTYSSASGDQEVLVSSDANTGSARTKTVTFTSTVGSITRMLTVSQEAGGPQEYTISLHPTSYDTENYSWRTSSNIERGYTNSSSTTYARFGIPKPYGEAYVYYKFDTSSIPDGAEIVSVECKAKAAASGNSTTTPTKLIQMATGTTLKGTATTITSTATERTLDVGEWTLAEIRDIRIRVYAKTGNTTSNYNLDFYGATLTITYTVGPAKHIVGSNETVVTYNDTAITY